MKPRKAPKRPRMQITPSPELWALVERVHGLTGEPRSAIVSELLDEIAPAFQTMISALELVKTAPREAQQLMTNFGAQAVGNLMQQQLELDKALDGRTVKGKRARRRAASGPT